MKINQHGHAVDQTNKNIQKQDKPMPNTEAKIKRIPKRRWNEYQWMDVSSCNCWIHYNLHINYPQACGFPSRLHPQLTLRTQFIMETINPNHETNTDADN